MQKKSSELYLLFQNKAHHYQNLQTVRVKVEDHLSRSLNHTINVIEKKKYDRDFPVNKRYSIDTENKNMTGRITSIYHTDDKVVLKDGSYSRYNKFERPFRGNNHFKNEEDRLIELENQKIKQNIERIKSYSRKHWEAQLKEHKKFTKKRDPSDHRNSRGSLKIDSKPFLAKPYLEFITHLQNDKKYNLKDSKASNKSKQKIQLEQQQLFILPQFPHKQQKLKKSKVSLSDEESSKEAKKQ